MENVLEILLDGDFAEKFKKMDDNLTKIEQHTSETSKKMTELVQTLDKLGGTLNGSVNTGLEKLSSGFGRLNEAISKMGSNSKSSLETTANETNKFINEINRLISGTESKKKSGEKSILDGLLFDTKELEDKRNKFAALISELESKAVSKGGRLFDTDQLISTGGTDAMKRLNVIIDNLRASIKNTQAYLENTTKKFYGGGAEFKYKELEKVEMAYARLTTRITDLRGKLQTATSLQPIIQELNSIRTEYNQVTSDLNTFVQKNKKLQDAEKNIKAYTDRIAEIENAFKRLTLSGGAFTKNGSMTKEAKALTDEKTMLEERIRLMRMTTDEAIKNEQRITAETEKQNAAKLAEFQKLYAERIALEKKSGTAETNRQLRDKQNLATDNEVRLLEVYSSRIREIDSIIKDLSKKYPELAKKAKEAYDIKSVEASVKEEERRAAAIDRVTNAQKRLNEQNAKKNVNDFNAKLGITEDPKTIEHYRIAIANLRKEIQKTTMDEAGAKTRSTLTKRMEEYKKKLQEVEGEQKKVANSAKGMGISLQKIASAFGIYFSVQSLANFGRKIVETTGEFELQHRALQAIIGDTQEANRLFDKTVALAVKSPYRIKDLVTYTKQLAAYRIETDKLYETNKMLSDISSGLGVDMGRLILAFGQVKAANYLRGQELRQFSEAGVNILGELSNYFSELEGRAISTGEVFDRVSKRMVSFGDVETVLKRLTEEGGIFFNMQEIQAETLHGKIMNLKDSFDIMINDIGKSNRGVIVGVIDSIKLFSDNWKSVEQVMKVVIGLFSAYKIVQISAAANMIKAGTAASVEELALGRLSSKIVQLMTSTNAATEANLRFSNSMKNASKANIFLAVLTAALTIIGAVVNASRRRNELDTELVKINGEINRDTNKMVSQYEKLASGIKDASTSEEDRIKLLEKMKRAYGDILPEKMLSIEYITKEGNSYEEATKKIKEYYNEIRRQRVIEKTEEMYGGIVDKAESRVADKISKIVSKSQGIDIDMLSITQALDKFSELFANGEITNSFEDFNRIFKEMTGVQLTMEEWAKTNASYFSITSGFSLDFDTYVRSIEQYNDKMRIATGRNEDFTKSIQDIVNDEVFKNGNLMMEKAFIEAVESGEVENDLNTKMQFFGNNAAMYFQKAFVEYMKKEGSVFNELNLYEKEKYTIEFGKMFQIKVDEKQMTIAQKTISGIVSDIERKYGLNKNQESVLNQLIIGSEESNTEFYDRAKRKLEGWLSNIRDMENKMVINDPILNNPEMKKAIEEYLEAIKKLAGEDKSSRSSGSGNPALERLNKQISAIKEANQQYEKYLELFDNEEAFRKVKNEFSGLFKELSMENWVESIRDFSDSEVKNAFDGKLKSSVDAAGKKGREAAEKFATEWQYQIDKTDFDTAMKSFTEGMDDAFSQYDLYKELEKLGIGGDISEYVFGISTLSVNQLKKRLEEAKQQLGMFGNGTGAEEEIKKMEKKISEIEDKERVERLKKYTEYLIKGRDEALKIKIDELRQLAELQDLQSGENPSYTSDQEAEIRENIRKETQKLLDKNVYDSFKNSSFYTMIFDDMAHVTDRSLDVMYEKLSELREKLQELDPSQVKEIVSAMNKIEGERRSRHPFKNITEDLEILSKWNEKENDERLIELQKEYSDLANEKADAIERAAKAQVEYDKVSSDEIEGNELVAKADLDNANKALNEILDKMRKIGIEIDGINQTNTEGRAALEGMFKAAEKGIEIYDAIGKVVKSVSDAIVEIYGFTDESTKRLIDDIANITANQGALASNIVKAIQSKGTDVQAMAEGIINTIETIRYIVDWAGIKWVEEIDEQERDLRRLENAAEDLRDALEGAFTTKQLTEYNRQLKENLTLQIDSYNAMIDAEEQKKNADKDQIQEWRDAISNLRKDIVDQENDFYEALGGVVDFRSASEEFVDAWYEAFKETGDGMDGLEEHFNEMLLNMVKKQAVMKVTDKFLKGIYDMIDLNLEDGELTPSEMTAIMAKAQEVFPELNEWLKTFFDSFGDFGETAENNLTGLQKGIQGVTEETAEIIAAYMNAIRFYSIDSNTQLRSIAAAITDNSGQLNPMLVELRNIAHRTDDIYSFLYQRRENGTDSIRVSIVS